MAKKFLGFAALLIGFLAYVAFKPADYKISRETIVNTSPDKIFSYINNTKKMNEWMPWKDQDPQVVMKYSGPEEGVGAISSWESPGKMGTGTSEIVESNEGHFVKVKLNYIKPMAMQQMAEINLQIFGETTKVRWSVEGENSYMGKLFSVFVNMDKIVGSEFEKGLAKLKTIAEQNQNETGK